MNQRTSLLLALALAACGGTQKTSETPVTNDTAQPAPAATPVKQAPPPSGPARDIAFPEIEHVKLPNGLRLDVVKKAELPIVNLTLVIESGSASDPAALPGLAAMVADMLREGTKKHKAADFAEAVEFLGANLYTGAGQESVRVSIQAMSEHLEPALELLAEAVLMPSFDAKELDKLKKRTLDDLKLKMDKPAWLARREMAKQLYGAHPYGRFDTTEDAIKKTKRDDLVRFHAAHFVPNNAFLVAVGDVTRERIEAASARLFGKWKAREVAAPGYAAPPAHAARKIVVVDRPSSVQSQIAIANLALKRNAPDYVRLLVANQVLGGSAASRLFMDLREKRSLTYGAYSRLDEAVDVGAFRVGAAVRNAVTGEAMAAFFEHLERIVREPPPADELAAAHRFLADSFPLQIETADSIAGLVADLTVFGLPDTYWDTFRSAIRDVTPDAALAAAKTYIHPESAVIVVVGRAAEIVPMLEKYGTVEVVDVNGKPVSAATSPEAKPAAPATKSAPNSVKTP